MDERCKSAAPIVFLVRCLICVCSASNLAGLAFHWNVVTPVMRATQGGTCKKVVMQDCFCEMHTTITIAAMAIKFNVTAEHLQNAGIFCTVCIRMSIFKSIPPLAKSLVRLVPCTCIVHCADIFSFFVTL